MGYEKDIMHQCGRYHVLRREHVGYFEVYRAGATAAELVATFHFSNRPAHALELAIDDCVRRAREELGRDSRRNT